MEPRTLVIGSKTGLVPVFGLIVVTLCLLSTGPRGGLEADVIPSVAPGSFSLGHLQGQPAVPSASAGRVLELDSGGAGGPWSFSSAAEAQSAAITVAKASRALAAEGDLEAALEKAEEAFALARAEFGDGHVVTGFVLDDLATLNYRLGRLEEALAYAERAVPVVEEARGRGSVDAAAVAGNRATILTALGRFAEALPLYLEAHDTFVRELGEAHERTAQTARNLGITYSESGDLEAARNFFEQALRARRSLDGDRSARAGRAMLDLAGVLLELEDLEAARAAALQARAIFKAGESAPIDLAEVDVILARLEIQKSELGAAENRLREALTALEAAGAGESRTAASILYNQGTIHVLRRQAVEAEQVYKRVLALYRQEVGAQHPAVARTLHSLAIIYGNLDQIDEAERFFRLAIDSFTESFGPDDPSVAASRLELGLMLAENGRADEAIAEAEAAIAIFDRLDQDVGIKRAYAASSLGFGLKAAGRLEEAALAFERATRVMREIRGPGSSDLPPGLTALGEIYLSEGDLERAEARLEAAIRIQEKDAARTGPALAATLAALADVRRAQNRDDAALNLMRRAVALMRDRLDVVGRSFSAAAPREQSANRGLFEQFLDVARVVRERDASPALLEEMFQVAQYPQLTGTAAAISRMAARFASGEDDLARLLRDRQDALEAWRARDARLTEALASGKLAAEEEAALRDDLERLDRQIETFDRDLQQSFPEFADLTQPRPVAVGATQTLLGQDEALFLHVTGASGSHLLLVQSGGLHYAHTPFTDADLRGAVMRLRQGLDLLTAASLADLPPFDTDAAYMIYQGLLEPFAPFLEDVDRLIFMPDRAMQNLPPSLLLRAPADPVGPLGDFEALDFLVRHHAITVVPSVSALRALRQVGRRSEAPDPFVGFGDPDFQGEAGDMRGLSIDLVYRNATEVDVRALRQLQPLPESKYELQALAAALGAHEDVVFLGSRASEREVKSADLERYRVVAMATHGFLSGEFPGLAEPALAMTPPEHASLEDDGLLTASEVAALDLDADLVILSACNTAAPAGEAGAEGLSGLARAFFYAGSRTLYVSHWYVDSQAAAEITTGSVDEMQADMTRGPAEALRQTMLRLLDGEKGPVYRHPVFWAPFVTVGEGGA